MMYGSVIFTFNSSLNRPRITTHISVAFHEVEQTEDSGPHLRGSGAVSVPSSTLQLGIGNAPRQALDAQVRSAQDVVMALINPGPSDQNVSQARDLHDFG